MITNTDSLVFSGGKYQQAGLNLEDYRGYEFWHRVYEIADKHVISTLVISPTHIPLIEEFIQEDKETVEDYKQKVRDFIDKIEAFGWGDPSIDYIYRRDKSQTLADFLFKKEVKTETPTKSKTVGFNWKWAWVGSSLLVPVSFVLAALAVSLA